MSTNMGNLEKLGILVIVILVVVVGVVAITPKSTVDEQFAASEPDPTAMQPEPLDIPGQSPAGVDPWPDAGGTPGTPSKPLPGTVQLDPMAPPAPRYRTVKIQDRDTLAIIAKRELGSATRYQDLLDANPGINPAKLEKGRDLNIPLASEVVVSPIKPNDGNVTPTATEQIYVVKSGDTLSEIARRTMGSRNRWGELAKANEAVLHGKTDLKVNMKLRIPASTSMASNDTVAPAPSGNGGGALSAVEREYVVQTGDSLWLIAKREMGSEACLSDLRTANKDALKGSDALRVGMKLKLPAQR